MEEASMQTAPNLKLCSMDYKKSMGWDLTSIGERMSFRLENLRRHNKGEDLETTQTRANQNERVLS